MRIPEFANFAAFVITDTSSVSSKEDIKAAIAAGRAFPLMEEFYSIQGEGYHSGLPAYFLRIGGCDVGCVWCDVKESWEANNHPVETVEDMIGRVKASGAANVVVTGGEPTMYQLQVLTDALHKIGCQTWLETSGAHPITGDWDWICFSPKKFKAPLASAYQQANELKVVAFHSSDMAWAETHAKKVNTDCHLFLQPEWSRTDRITSEVIAYCLANPQWRISLQTHKYLNVR